MSTTVEVSADTAIHAGQEPDDEVFKRLLDTRYSCRSFLPNPVPPETIRRILEIAGRTASNNNAQPWQAIVLSGAGMERFRKAAVDFVQNEPWAPDYPVAQHFDIYKERSRECGLALYRSVGVTREDKQGTLDQQLRNYKAFDAPHLALITSDIRQGTFGALDCGAYIANFMLAARSVGVDSIAQCAFALVAPLVRRHFGLGDDRVVLNGISFGYADTSQPVNQFRTSRAPLEEIVTFVNE